MTKLADECSAAAGGSSRWGTALEVMLIVLLFFLHSGWPPPDVNEAHYVAKAKHYWQPEWCPDDHFLASADAHLVFYWTFGWLTQLAPLAVVTWIGRFLTWGLLAWSWQRLSWTVAPKPFLSLVTACGFLLFNGHFHMAGEWVVGGVEAKGPAYALVFLALRGMLRQRWNIAWVLLGLATALHPLVGGWSLVAGGFAWLTCGRLRPSLTSMWPGLAAAVLLALPGLIPALLLNRGVEAATVLEANTIYVYQRLPHHLVFHRFPHWFIARHALLLALWLIVCLATPCAVRCGVLGQRPLRGFVSGALLLSLIGIVIDQSLLHHLDVAATLLKYYWYRLGDVALPAGAVLAIAAWAVSLQARRPAWGQAVLIALGLVAAGDLAWSNYQRRQDLRPLADVQVLPSWSSHPAWTRRAYEDWRQACQWIAEQTPPDACFITPKMQQTFKWYAGRSEVCCWKDVPQDAAELVEWWHRQQELYPRRVRAGGLAAHGPRRLRELAEKYAADYVVLDRYASPRPLPFPRVHPPAASPGNSAYEVYRIVP